MSIDKFIDRIKNGEYTKVCKMIDDGIDLNSRIDKTPLSIACKTTDTFKFPGNKEIIKKMIKYMLIKGANPNLSCKTDKNIVEFETLPLAIILNSKYPNRDIIIMLFEHGANSNPEEGISYLYVAIRLFIESHYDDTYDIVELVKLLLQHNCEINSTGKEELKHRLEEELLNKEIYEDVIYELLILLDHGLNYNTNMTENYKLLINENIELSKLKMKKISLEFNIIDINFDNNIIKSCVSIVTDTQEFDVIEKIYTHLGQYISNYKNNTIIRDTDISIEEKENKINLLIKKNKLIEDKIKLINLKLQQCSRELESLFVDN